MAIRIVCRAARTRAAWLLVLTLASLVPSTGRAQDPAPVMRWDFGTEETTALVAHGGVQRDVPGPRPPVYPDFAVDNTAVRLDGRGAYLAFNDPGVQSPFDFTNGDAIALEAWVQVDELRRGENVYVVGKGRTGSPRFAADNQNWALRVREVGGKAGVSFLFATPPVRGATGSDAHWHRWTTNSGFAPGKAWHHIAVSYRFGSPESIRAWIDGQPHVGKWDMGGPTERPPVVDNDSIWIGSSRGGAAANSFRGRLDSIAIYRAELTDAALKSRYRREGDEAVAMPLPEMMPELGELPPGQVQVALHEGMPTHDRWLNDDETLPPATRVWQTEAMLLERLPHRYDAWGIRDSWHTPVLLRMATDAKLPPGKHRFVMRVRGLSRLWVNGQLVARSKPLIGSPNGEEPITPVTAPLAPGMRLAEHRQQEVVGEATIGDDGACRVVLESIIGGAKFRADPGELCVAVEAHTAAGDAPFVVLPGAPAASSPVWLTDADVLSALARQASALRQLDDEARRAAAASQAPFWHQRHEAARQWAAAHPAPQAGRAEGHPIDAFLQAKVDQHLAASAKTSLAEARQFHDQVLPILRDQCFRCHGEKANGGLRLNSREATLQGGDSETPAVVPGKVDESELIRRIRATDPDERMPPGADGLTAEAIAALEAWVKSGAAWPAPPVAAEDVAAPDVVSDAAFLRRAYLDTVGVPPSEQAARDFLADPAPDKRLRLIDQLLADDRWADHWVSYWQDALAENPTLINASLNTSGPFRWFLYESLRDNKPWDRLVTELILQRGSPHEGGSAGFGLAGNNDAPMAAKGQIVASAFLGIELQCARCHDSPYHSTLQRDLYALAALFERKPVIVPATSRVPAAFFEKKQRESLIKVTLRPDEPVPPEWPFAEVTGVGDAAALAALMQQPDDPRERLAALITAPQNQRFAQVLVNRVWRRLLGAGLVEPPDDWEGRAPSHPELLQWLAEQLITHNYDLKHVARLILTSTVYQRQATGRNREATAELRFFLAPDRRRLTAEQVVDSLFASAGQPIGVEELTFDPDGRRPASNRLTLGVPHRAWMLANLANERDRPSLNLPRARAVTDIMEAFGWSGARQNPRTDREMSPNVLQPGVLANSAASVWLTRAVWHSGLAETALAARSPEQLVDSLFLRYLSRLPTDEERRPLAAALAVDFPRRGLPAEQIKPPTSLEPLPRVTWSNHLRPEANSIALEMEHRARLGPPADPRLQTEWREVYEDVVWSIINLREFVWMP